MLEFLFVKYEISNSWWAAYVFWGWGQNLAADYYLWKVRRKLKKMRFHQEVMESLRTGSLD